jgi:hypothetical protein
MSSAIVHTASLYQTLRTRNNSNTVEAYWHTHTWILPKYIQNLRYLKRTLYLKMFINMKHSNTVAVFSY